MMVFILFHFQCLCSFTALKDFLNKTDVGLFTLVIYGAFIKLSKTLLKNIN